MKKWTGLVLIIVALLFILSSLNNNKNQDKKAVSIAPKFEYGIPLDSFIVTKSTVSSGQTFGALLYENHIDHPKIHEIVMKSAQIFDFGIWQKGNTYTLISSMDSLKKLIYFVYEIDPVNYVVIDLRQSVDVYRGEKEVLIRKDTLNGVINTSLSSTILAITPNPALVEKISEIYAWTIDFFKIQKGDAFKIYYENRYIKGGDNKMQFVGMGKIIAAEFTHKNQNFYAFYFKGDNDFGEYFDEEGRTLRKAFLKAPLNFYRISSRYSKNRKHPVTGKWKGHFGTDYAAPKGTPIMTTANGVIQRAGYSRNNGNFVKVRHNGTYTTQYLHMSKIKTGIKKGVYVKQGEIIGYVGSTGLATGPHVCYRFWKNGRQVDPYTQKLPPGDPIKEKDKDEYLKMKDNLMQVFIKKE